MKKKYFLIVNNFQKGRYLPLFEECIVKIEKIDRAHHKVTVKVTEAEKEYINRCFKDFRKELQPC